MMYELAAGDQSREEDTHELDQVARNLETGVTNSYR